MGAITPPAAPPVHINPKLAPYNAVGDGVTDDRAALVAAVAAAIAQGALVRLPPGNYRVSKYVPIVGAIDFKIIGSAFSTITFASDDLTIIPDSTATTHNQARSGLLLKSCNRVTVEGITFVGGTATDLTYQNVGAGVYASRCVGIRVIRCPNRYGAQLFAQDANFNTGGISGNVLGFSGSTVTLTNNGDPNNAFHKGMEGRNITIVNATDPRNNGTYVVSTVLSSTQLTYTNANGAAEPSSSSSWGVEDGDQDTIIQECSSINARHACYTGRGGIIKDCEFIRPGQMDRTGIPDFFTVTGSTVVMTDANADWDASILGSYIKIEGSTTHNSIFKITAVTVGTRFTPATLTFTNPGAPSTETADPATTTWWIAGGERSSRGNGASAISTASGVVTFTSAEAIFKSDDVGKIIRLTDATASSGVNNGQKVITRFISTTQVQYVQSSAVNESYTGVFSVDGYDNSKNDSVVGPALLSVASTAVAANSLTFAGAMVTNAYAASILTDAGNRQWLITSNNATTFTLAGTGTPTAGLFTVDRGTTYALASKSRDASLKIFERLASRFQDQIIRLKA
jgi:Pectate lyase superfamily protein